MVKTEESMLCYLTQLPEGAEDSNEPLSIAPGGRTRHRDNVEGIVLSVVAGLIEVECLGHKRPQSESISPVSRFLCGGVVLALHRTP